MTSQKQSLQEPSTTLFKPSSKYHEKVSPRRRRWLVVDFDGTCTEHDTTPLLPKLAALASSRQRQGDDLPISEGGADSNSDSSSHGHEQDLQRRLSRFKELENEYLRLFEEAKSALLSEGEDIGEAGGAKRQQSIHDVLDALDRPSTRVTHMVSESRVLEGLGHADAKDLANMLQLHSAGSDNTPMNEQGDKIEGEIVQSAEKVVVRLRNGCKSTLARILLDNDASSGGEGEPICLGWSLAVLSINWCPELIHASLVNPVIARRREILQVDSCETEIPVWSNHVDGEGKVTLHVPGALAKRDRIRQLRSHDDDGVQNVIVYVGDSSTDLSALIEADLGIVIGTSSSMSSIAERWGVEIVSLQDRLRYDFMGAILGGKPEDNDRPHPRLWKVECWKEIDDVLIEIDKHWSQI